MSEIRVTELDFNGIKENLKNFLKSQDQFSDYDFEGAGLSVLIDLLAYNTHYNAMLAHLQANEMFIDTAIKRSSVVSLAKTLGYTPRSSTCARSRVNIEITVPSETTLILPEESTTFTGLYEGNVYTFNLTSTQSKTSTDGVFLFEDVEILEGSRVTNSFVVASDTTQGPFVLPNSNVDVNTLRVLVYQSTTNLVETPFTKASSIIDITDTDKVFWVEENPDGKYQIIFGDNIIGKALIPGNVVVVSYLVSSGIAANGTSTFSLDQEIPNATSVTVTTVNKAASGSEREGIDSIRFNAPKFNATRNRAVTAEDYKSLIMSQFPRIKSVAVWGGEENMPPIFGKVFITLDPLDGEVFTDADKDFITEQILRPRTVMSIQHEFVDSDDLYLGFDIDIRYNPKNTTLTPSDIKAQVESGIDDYFTANLRTLEKTFIFSQFVDYIQNLLPNRIVGVLAKLKLQRRIRNITLGTSSSRVVRFLTSLIPESFRSSKFNAVVNGITYEAYIKDFSNSDTIDFSGKGTLKLIDSATGVILTPSLGSIDYETGVVIVNNLIVDSFVGAIDELRLNAVPQDLGKNISPAIVQVTEYAGFAQVPYPAKNTILQLDDSEVDTDASVEAGLKIVVTPYLK